MLDDHAGMYGSRTKWKLTVILLVLAGLALAVGYFTARPFWKEQICSSGKALLAEAIPWTDFPCDGSVEISALEDGAVISCGGVLYHLDSRGNVMDRLDTGLAAVQLLSGRGPAAWSGNAVYCALPDGFASMDMPSGVLALDSDGRHISVITRGSGYLTVTKLLDFTGQETGQIGLLDAAMVETAVAGNVTGGLCVDTQGVWSLRLYDLAGTELLRRDLPDENRCHLKAAGEAFAVLCENTILFYDIQGNEVGSGTLEQGFPELWRTDAEGAVLCYGSGGCSTLLRIAMEGHLVGTVAHNGSIRDIALSDGKLYVLDYQCVTVYDNSGRLLEREAAGARAAVMAPGRGGLWLAGNGEIAKIITK